jgi:hypothetical protein
MEISATISAVANATSDEMVAVAPGLCVGGPMCADYVDPVSCETETIGRLRGLQSKKCNWTRSCDGYCTGPPACEGLQESECSNSIVGCAWECEELLGSPWEFIHPGMEAAKIAYTYAACVEPGHTCHSPEWWAIACCHGRPCEWRGGEKRCA